MNTAKSVAYGWGVLIVAAGGAYYFAKKENEAKWREKTRGIITEPKRQMTWQDKVAEFEASQTKQSAAAQEKSPAHKDALSPGPGTNIPHDNATRGSRDEVKQVSRPTGVDTPHSGAGVQENL